MVAAVKQNARSICKMYGDGYFLQGVPFQNITGPKSKNAQFTVIGAGLFGLHMASLLNETGLQKCHFTRKIRQNRRKTLTVAENGRSMN